MHKRIYKTMNYLSFHDMMITEATFRDNVLSLTFDGVYCFLENNKKKGVFASDGEQKLILSISNVINWYDWEEEIRDYTDFSILNGKTFLALTDEGEKKSKLIYSIGEIELEIRDGYAEIVLDNLYWYRGLEKEEERNYTDLPISSLPIPFF